MKAYCKEGKIVAEGRGYESAAFELGNRKISVTADGRGGLSAYRVTNRGGNLLSSLLSLDLSFGGDPLSPYLEKKVEMIGRMQKITFQTDGDDLTVTTFLTEEVNGVFFLLSCPTPFALSLNSRDAKSATRNSVTFVEGNNFMLSSSVAGDWVEENSCFYAGETNEVRLLLTFDGEKQEHLAAFRDFSGALNAAQEEIAAVRIPSSVHTEEEKALYLSAYFTALQNYKTCGDFRAFAAGIRYTDPLRTYFRDSYYTVLPMLTEHPEFVRNEILTLARGINEEGACPSAVKSDFTAFWGDHYDSPSFFVIQLYDYLTATGDASILDETISGEPLLRIVQKVLARLKGKTDETGLLYKEGSFNKRDWADEVNRNGYVTFVEALYYRALVAASRLFEKSDPKQASLYQADAEKVKQAINSLLFDEELGYYVNYKSSAGVEKNLSLDTLFTLLFGVADEDKAKRVLDNVERLCESKNNPDLGGEDFGVACAFPPYGLPRATCHKSSRPYDYHNGANWCYLTAIYAYAKALYGRDWRTPLLSTFRYLLDHGHYTLLEYFSPACPEGSPLQAWSAAIAFVYQKAENENFFK